MAKFRVTILTLFPEMFPGPLGYSLAGNAYAKNIWSLDVINIRDFGLTKHQNVDDEPYGGGNGLVMRADVLGSALDHAQTINPRAKIYYPSPRGKVLNQSIAKEIIAEENIIILCGRFEGIDERVIDEYNATEISIGDYILSGGEIAGFAIIDACIRLLPGVLANQETLMSESFEGAGNLASLLEYPLYTRPQEWRGKKVPDVLLSGNHKQIKEWQFEQAKLITSKRRPDLLKDKDNL
jgi:tRNA (guanine37-N1)-methyltransferase